MWDLRDVMKENHTKIKMYLYRITLNNLNLKKNQFTNVSEQKITSFYIYLEVSV